MTVANEPTDRRKEYFSVLRTDSAPKKKAAKAPSKCRPAKKRKTENVAKPEAKQFEDEDETSQISLFDLNN